MVDIDDNSSVCGFCGMNSHYVFEWHSLNQFGEDPRVIHEVGVCCYFGHMLDVGFDSEYGIADALVSVRDYNKEYPHVIKAVNLASERPELLEAIVKDLDIEGRQRSLF